MATVSMYFHGANDGDDGPFFLTNTGGWSDTTDWIATLPIERYPLLHQLAMDGGAEDTVKIGAELKKARKQYPPEGWVPDIIQELLEKMGVGAHDENLAILA